MRTPTEIQYLRLLAIADGGYVHGLKSEVEPLLKQGYVTVGQRSKEGWPYMYVRITAEGLRAAALGVERYRLPTLNNGFAPTPSPWKWNIPVSWDDPPCVDEVAIFEALLKIEEALGIHDEP